MGRENRKERKYIDSFNPDVMTLWEAHQDFSVLLKKFNAGAGYENFNEFLYDENDEEVSREVVSFYTLAATAILYEDRIRLDEEEAKQYGKEFDIQICGISALEIKMFAVDERFQDLFYRFEGEELPVSAWIMKSIIDYAYSLLGDVVGFKALFLHSVPDAEEFYLHNGFNVVKENMQPLHCIDSEYKAMYLALKAVHMNYDE